MPLHSGDLARITVLHWGPLSRLERALAVCGPEASLILLIVLQVCVSSCIVCLLGFTVAVIYVQSTFDTGKVSLVDLFPVALYYFIDFLF